MTAYHWPPPYQKCQECKSDDGRDVYLIKRSSKTSHNFKVRVACKPCIDSNNAQVDGEAVSRNPPRPDNF
jgi:5-methylcytosine-specific restriction endonuclease McrA